MTQWWELAIPAAAGVIGATLGAATQGWNARRLYLKEAEERRQARFADERRVAYVKFLLAFGEWEPLRAEAWRLRERMDHSDNKVAAEKAWRAARAESEAPFRRFSAANQEVQIIAPKPVREAATKLFVEASRTTEVLRYGSGSS